MLQQMEDVEMLPKIRLQTTNSEVVQNKDYLISPMGVEMEENESVGPKNTKIGKRNQAKKQN